MNDPLLFAVMTILADSSSSEILDVGLVKWLLAGMASAIMGLAATVGFFIRAFAKRLTDCEDDRRLLHSELAKLKNHQ